MPRGNTIQTNFTAGEISPAMYGRIDINKYFNGARKLQNMIVLPQGGAYRRPGTQLRGFVNQTGLVYPSSFPYTVLRKFVISAEQSYVCEFGDGTLRFWTQAGGLIGGGSPVLVNTPYLWSDLPFLCTAQEGDVMYVTHPNYPTYKLTYFSDTNWTFTQVVFNDGPYLPIDQDTTNKCNFAVTSDSTTLVVSTAPGSTTLTSTTSLFASGNVGSYVEYLAKNVGGTKYWGLALITGFTNATTVAATVQSAILFGGSYPTITASGTALYSTTAFFTSTMVGMFVRLKASYAWYLITAVTDSQHATGTLQTSVTFNEATTTVYAGANFLGASAGQYIEFQNDGQWFLSKIISINDPTSAQVTVYDNVVNVPSGAKCTVGSTTTTTDVSGVFTPNMVGMYVRDTVNQKWGLITAYGNTGSVTTTLVAVLVAYTYPTTVATILNNRVITGVLTCNTAFLNPATDVGVNVRLHFGGSWRFFTATSFNSPTSAIGTLSDFMPWDDTNATYPYNGGWADEFQLPSWTAENGYPAVCCFHQDRLCFANCPNQPTTIWCSESDDYESLAPTLEDGTVVDSNSIYATITGSKVNPITWMQSGQVLMVGTEGDEFQVTTTNFTQALSPTNFVAINQTSFGGQKTDFGMRSNIQTLFIQNGGTKIREMTYMFQYSAFNAVDISVVSEHLFRNVSGNSTFSDNPLSAARGIIKQDLGHVPFTVEWLLLANGTVVSMTYEKEQEIVAFTPHIIGGNGYVESVCVTPDPVDGTDVVWMVVRRPTPANGWIRTIESFRMLDIYLTPNYMDMWVQMSFDPSLVPPYQVQDAIGYAGIFSTSNTTMGPVQVMVDGFYIGTKNVVQTFNPVGYGFTLNYTVQSSCVAGFEFDCILGTLDVEGGASQGNSQAKPKKVSKSFLRLYNSPHPLVGSPKGMTDDSETVRDWQDPQLNDLRPILPIVKVIAGNPNVNPFPTPGTAPKCYTADIEATLDDSYNTGGRFWVAQTQPYPLRINAIIHEVDTNA